jgi:hypothetical protein
MSTNSEGVSAAGEVVDSLYCQVLTASTQGVQAAIDVQKFLRHEGFDEIISTINKVSSEDENDETTLTECNQVDCNLTTSDCIKFIVQHIKSLYFRIHIAPFVVEHWRS